MMNWSVDVAYDENEAVSAHQESEDEGPLLGNVCSDDLHDLPSAYDVAEVRAGLLRAHQRMIRMVRRWLPPRRRRRAPQVFRRVASRRERRARSRRSSRASPTARPARAPDPEPPSCSRAQTFETEATNISNSVASAADAPTRPHV
jgi:hypothetical protein